MKLILFALIIAGGTIPTICYTKKLQQEYVDKNQALYSKSNISSQNDSSRKSNKNNKKIKKPVIPQNEQYKLFSNDEKNQILRALKVNYDPNSTITEFADNFNINDPEKTLLCQLAERNCPLDDIWFYTKRIHATEDCPTCEDTTAYKHKLKTQVFFPNKETLVLEGTKTEHDLTYQFEELKITKEISEHEMFVENDSPASFFRSKLCVETDQACKNRLKRVLKIKNTDKNIKIPLSFIALRSKKYTDNYEIRFYLDRPQTNYIFRPDSQLALYCKLDNDQIVDFSCQYLE